MSPPGSMTDSHRGMRGYARVPCAKRKVKCDRREPCTNCSKRQIKNCLYSGPIPKRRAQKSHTESMTLERLKRLENIIRDMGGDPGGDADLTPDPTHSTDRARPSNVPSRDKDDFFVPLSHESVATVPQDNGTGRLLTDSQSKSRFLDDTLWCSLGDEVSNEHDLLDEDGMLSDHHCTNHAIGQSQASDGPSSLLLGGPRPHLKLSNLHPESMRIQSL